MNSPRALMRCRGAPAFAACFGLVALACSPHAAAPAQGSLAPTQPARASDSGGAGRDVAPTEFPADPPAGGESPPSSCAEAAVLDTLRGKASYYSDRLIGNRTASGERYNARLLTAAHRTLRFGTLVRVTRLPNGPSVTVTVNDRGPFGNSRRIIDLSRAAAERLQMLRAGVVDVSVEVLDCKRSR